MSYITLTWWAHTVHTCTDILYVCTCRVHGEDAQSSSVANIQFLGASEELRTEIPLLRPRTSTSTTCPSESTQNINYHTMKFITRTWSLLHKLWCINAALTLISLTKALQMFRDAVHLPVLLLPALWPPGTPTSVFSPNPTSRNNSNSEPSSGRREQASDTHGVGCQCRECSQIRSQYSDYDHLPSLIKDNTVSTPVPVACYS